MKVPSWAEMWSITKAVLGQFLSPGVSIYWVYLAAAGILAVLVYLWRHRRLQGLLGYLLPREVWLSRSTLNDFCLFVLNTLIYSFWLLVPLSWISTHLGQWTWLQLHEAFGPVAEPLSGWPATLGVAAATFVVADLAFFIGHTLVHRVPVLWEFHKVHHSAPVMQPMTVLRRHPVVIVIDGAISGVLLGALLGLFGWLGGGQLGPLTVYGVNVLLLVCLVGGFNLQHSHVWLSFGPLDRWLISPATHQLHHSAAPAHYDHNFGNLIAVWDRLAGTLLTPAEAFPGGGDRKLEFGLGPRGEAWEREYSSVWRLYLWPVWRALLVLTRRVRR